MKKNLPILLCLLLLGACEPEEAPREETRIMDNLPISDRDLLLKPLESALDDLREAIRQDGSYFSSSHTFDQSGIQGEVQYKLDGADTMMISVECRSGDRHEYHEQFRDDRGNLFYSSHRFESLEAGVNAIAPLRAYKFYYEDKGMLLSTYARMDFEEGAAGEWTPVCLTTEEERFIQGRINHFRQMRAKGS